MAFFRVGMRVRHVGQGKPYANSISNSLIGATGVLAYRIGKGPRLGWWHVVIDGGIYNLDANEATLEPILPPHEAADDAEFIKDLDRLLEQVGEGV